MTVFRLSAVIILITALSVMCLMSSTSDPPDGDTFSFIIASDMRNYSGGSYDSPEYFKGACLAIAENGKGAFMISAGDIDPPGRVDSTVHAVLGDDYPWYPVVGNHESETPEDMIWLRQWGSGNIPHLVRKGPVGAEETCYSFDYENIHIAVINQYYDGVSDAVGNGDMGDALYQWLRDDLASTHQPIVFVAGHEPLVSMPDIDTGRHRHKGDNLDLYPENNYRFQALLKEYGVAAYLCGHTHSFSIAKINDIWQIDSGHARGAGDPGTPSTFLKMNVGKDIRVDVYRADAEGLNYSLKHSFILD